MAMDLSDQINILQQAQQSLAEAMKSLGEHNQAEEAHPIILRMIQDLQQNESIYTRAEISELITRMLKEHTRLSFETAHPGWEDYAQAIEARLSKIEADIYAIQRKLEGEAEAEDPRSPLDKELQKIENKYAPILANLQQAFMDAEQAGNPILAETYRDAIGTTLEEKRQELLQVMTTWMAEQKEGDG